MGRSVNCKVQWPQNKTILLSTCFPKAQPNLWSIQTKSQLRPQSTQSAGPVRFLIFCSVSIFLLARLVAGRGPPVFCRATVAGNVLNHTYPLEYQICSSQPRQKSCWASSLRIQPLGLRPAKQGVSFSSFCIENVYYSNYLPVLFLCHFYYMFITHYYVFLISTLRSFIISHIFLIHCYVLPILILYLHIFNTCHRFLYIIKYYRFFIHYLHIFNT